MSSCGSSPTAPVADLQGPEPLAPTRSCWRITAASSLLVFTSYWAIDFTIKRNPGLELAEALQQRGEA